MGLLLASILALGLTAETQVKVPDLRQHFKGLDGTFVLLNGATGEYVRHNPARAALRFAPCSTFKIPHTAILLETGAAPSPAYRLAYERSLRQPAHWARNFDLTGAFRASALWYYQRLAQRVGMDTERRFLQQFEYGAGTLSGGLDKMGSPFWVDGSLIISADEQVEFLRRFYEGRLGLSERTTQLTRSIMLAEETPAWRHTGRFTVRLTTAETGTPALNRILGRFEVFPACGLVVFG